MKNVHGWLTKRGFSIFRSIGTITKGRGKAGFLGERVIKYHRTLTAHLKVLLKDSLEIEDFVELAAASGKCERLFRNRKMR